MSFSHESIRFPIDDLIKLYYVSAYISRIGDVMDVIHDLGSLALGSRLKRISDRFMAEATQIYSSQDVAFESRWFPLFSLLARVDCVSVGQAASSLGVTHSAVSQTVQEMLNKGVIISSVDPQDRKRVVLSLSTEGKKLLLNLEPLWSDIGASVDEILRATGVDLVSILARLESTLDSESIFSRTQKRLHARMYDQIQIVDYKPELNAHFQRLNEEWITKFFKIEESDRKVFSNPKREIIDRGGYILFAIVQKDVLGTVALYKRGSGVYEIGKLAVTAKAQGRHIGKKLMHAAVERAAAKSATKVFLETNDILTPAINLYRSIGFVPRSNSKSETLDRVNLIMELDLTASRSTK